MSGYAEPGVWCSEKLIRSTINSCNIYESIHELKRAMKHATRHTSEHVQHALRFVIHQAVVVRLLGPGA